MVGSLFKLCSAVFCVSLLSGCASNAVTQEEHSGFLSEAEYQEVTEIELEDGDTVYRWVNPKFNQHNYPALMVDQVVFYPEPTLSESVTQEDLDQIANYLTQTLKTQLGKTLTITDQAGPGVAQLTSAITGVEIKNEGMKAYEVIPIAAIFAAAQVATDSRDKVTEVYLESKLQDAVTGEALVIAFRKVRGSNADDAQNQLALENVQASLDEVVQDAIDLINTKQMN